MRAQIRVCSGGASLKSSFWLARRFGKSSTCVASSSRSVSFNIDINQKQTLSIGPESLYPIEAPRMEITALETEIIFLIALRSKMKVVALLLFVLVVCAIADEHEARTAQWESWLEQHKIELAASVTRLSNAETVAEYTLVSVDELHNGTKLASFPVAATLSARAFTQKPRLVTYPPPRAMSSFPSQSILK